MSECGLCVCGGGRDMRKTEADTEKRHGGWCYSFLHQCIYKLWLFYVANFTKYMKNRKRKSVQVSRPVFTGTLSFLSVFR